MKSNQNQLRCRLLPGVLKNLASASVLPLLSWVPISLAQDAGVVDAAPAPLADSGQNEAPPIAGTIAVDPLAGSERAPAPPAPSATRGGIEEIVVTAQKREENIQDVPIAISAFSSEQLEAAGTNTTKDLGLITPSLQVTELAGFTLIFLRGVGSDIFVPSADPSVATYIDGIYVAPGQGFSQELGAIERVEVLKGPQGTLFGRNSTGGAISITSKKPGNETEVSLTSSYGSFNTQRNKAYVNIPLSDSLAFSVAGLYNTSESYYDRSGPYAHRGIQNDVAKAARVRLRWNPTDDIEVLLTGQRVKQNNSGSLVSASHFPSEAMQVAQLVQTAPPTDDAFRNYKTNVDTDPLSTSSQRSVYGQATWTLPWVDLKLLGSDQLVEGANQTDFDGTSRALVSFYSPRLFTDVQTAELQLLSNQDTPWSDTLKWVAGLYYFKSNGGFDPVLLSVSDSIIELPTGEVFNLIPQKLRDLLPGVPAPTGVDLYLIGLLETRSLAGYFQGTATLTDWMGVTFGGRYQEEKRTQSESSVNVINDDSTLTKINGYAPQSSKVSNFSPKLSLDFHLNDDVLVYTSAAKGFKSQTYNIINIYTPPDYVKPEEVTSYELGVKSTLLDNTIRLNAAVFQNKTKNLQSSFVSLLAGGAVNFQTAGGARTRGAELDITWVPLPDLDPGLLLTAGGSYLDGKYTDFAAGSGFDEVTGLYFSSRNFTGNEVVRTPKRTASVGIAQTIDTHWGSIDLGADGYYNSGFYFLPQNSALSRESSYALLNARIGAFYEPWGLRATFYGANLTGTKYNIAQFHTDFGRLDTQAPPASYGLRLNWDF